MPTGAHRADLFRYYYLYIEGGIFIDSDAMPIVSIDGIIDGCNFFSVASGINSRTIFQGFLGAESGNQIVYEALADAYSLDLNYLRQDYLLICRNLYSIVAQHKSESGDEIRMFREGYAHRRVAKITNDADQTILLHYWKRAFPPRHPRLYSILETLSDAVWTVVHPRKAARKWRAYRQKGLL